MSVERLRFGAAAEAQQGPRLGPADRRGGPTTRAGATGIVARPIHGLGIDTPRPGGLASAYRARMPSAATAVELYGAGDSGDEIHLELLAPAGARRRAPEVNKA